MIFNLENLVRENIKRLTPYSSARSEFSGAAQIYLDANENSFGSPLGENYHRYPDPLQTEIKRVISDRQNVERIKFSSATAATKRLICCSEFSASRARIMF
jgi:histidinol-phosphate aminotransferase